MKKITALKNKEGELEHPKISESMTSNKDVFWVEFDGTVSRKKANDYTLTSCVLIEESELKEIVKEKDPRMVHHKLKELLNSLTE